MSNEELQFLSTAFEAERPHWTNRYDAMEQAIRALKQAKEAFPEKQKEQKPEPVFKVGDKIKPKSEPKYPYREIVDIRDEVYYFDESEIVPFDMQDNWEKEQKPMEPSDEELQRHQDELYDFKVFAAKQAKEHHISFVHDFEWNNFCAEILSYFNEQQKPAEWSEEDEKMLNGIIERGNSEIPKGECGLTSNQVAWLKTRLKSLSERFNIQPKQEWNEEDLKWAEEIRLALFYYSNDRPFIEKLTNWFNNHIQPNPHWKPSEEQMEALRKASDLLVSDLNSLYNDLTKQM